MFTAPVYIQELAVYIMRTDTRPGDVTTSSNTQAPLSTTTAGATTTAAGTTTTVKTTTTTAGVTTSTASSNVFPSGTVFGSLQRISAGSTTPHTDALGRTWGIDEGFVSGTIYAISSTEVSPAIPSLDVVYATERNAARGSTMAYRFDVGSVTAVRVVLHFCELLDSSSNIGDRVMDVYLEGDLVAQGLDSVALFGYRVGGSVTYDVQLKVTTGEAV